METVRGQKGLTSPHNEKRNVTTPHALFGGWRGGQDLKDRPAHIWLSSVMT